MSREVAVVTLQLLEQLVVVVAGLVGGIAATSFAHVFRYLLWVVVLVDDAHILLVEICIIPIIPSNTPLLSSNSLISWVMRMIFS